MIFNPTGREQAKTQEKWAQRQYNQANQWRTEDIAYRDEQDRKNSLEYRMNELRSQGFHESMALGGGMGGGMGGGKPAVATSPGGRIPRPTPPSGVGQMSPVEQAAFISQIKLNEAEVNRVQAEADNINARTEEEVNNLKAATNLIRAQISSSQEMDKLTEKQREEIEERLLIMVRDRKIIEEGGRIFLSTSTTWQELTADLIRAGISERNARTVIRDLEIERSRQHHEAAMEMHHRVDSEARKHNTPRGTASRRF